MVWLDVMAACSLVLIIPVKSFCKCIDIGLYLCYSHMPYVSSYRHLPLGLQKPFCTESLIILCVRGLLFS